MYVKATLDTNVYISAFLFPGKTCRVIVDYAKIRTFSPVVSKYIIDEYKTKLREKFNSEEIFIDKSVSIILRICEFIHIDKKAPGGYTIDTYDNWIVETALLLRSDYLVTGDKKHLLKLENVNDVRIVSPGDFVEKVLHG